MIMMENEPKISERFDLNDIRAIREYNAARYEKMTPAEIVEDTRAGAADLLARMKQKKLIKV